MDTEDWRQPGAEAIVLFHDGGGDRPQTVEALETILETLSSQGYAFEVVCPY
jgi:peptidoglycan/xylan/chitin deacetylase (PgdA/CDA1 family)